MVKSLLIGVAIIGVAFYAAVAIHQSRFGYQGELTRTTHAQCTDWYAIDPRKIWHTEGPIRVYCDDDSAVRRTRVHLASPPRANWQDRAGGAVAILGIVMATAFVATATVLSNRRRSASA